jgi:RNA polymerase sigma-70 factor (ECF subfamily)
VRVSGFGKPHPHRRQERVETVRGLSIGRIGRHHGARRGIGREARNAGDEDLVGLVASGDEQALAELYDRYSRPVYATGLRLLGDAQLAEELVQDAFTSVWRSAASFDPERASFATWLYRVARNRATDLDRRRRVRPRPAGERGLYAIPGGPHPEEAVDAWDVATALSSIPSEHRQVLELAYFEDLSQREISRRTGLPLGTVKSRTTAALKRFQRAMTNPAPREARGE